MNQTIAIFVDAYRELNAKKLFWAVLILSALVVLVFFLVGIDENGMYIAGFHASNRPSTLFFERGQFYTQLYLVLGVGYWLTLAATILAILSTAGTFPDLIAGGSVDLFLSKPIGRLRLFLTKYAAALIFVFLQVTVFSVAGFLLLGIRGGIWAPGVFLAVPIVLIFYSYLYAVCVLIGLLTRSTITAILLTAIFWGVLFCVHIVETSSHYSYLDSQVAVERLTRVVSQRTAALKKYDDEGGEKTSVALRAPKVAELEKAKFNLAFAQEKVRSTWHPQLFAAKTLLPKTSETVALLDRYMRRALDFKRSDEELPPIQGESDAAPKSIFTPGFSPDHEKAEVRMRAELDKRTEGWVIGTSLAFEAVILGIAAWIFCRRDY